MERSRREDDDEEEEGSECRDGMLIAVEGNVDQNLEDIYKLTD